MPAPPTSVSVIVPFVGSPGELATVCARLERLPATERLVADNRPRPAPGMRGGVRVLDASGPRSSYFARQVAARAAVGEWLVFLDADCDPDPTLLDGYFAVPPGAEVAVLAGAVVDHARGDSLVERYIAARRKLDQAATLAHPRAPYAQTANAAFRRSAFLAAGGFDEPVRSGGDADLCWRLQSAGHRLESRPRAVVRHENRRTLRALLAQLHRHGSGMQWLDRRYPGAFPLPGPRELIGRAKLLAPRGGDARHAVIDVLSLFARDLGRLRANGDPTPWPR